jgi:hypothetical protein
MWRNRAAAWICVLAMIPAWVLGQGYVQQMGPAGDASGNVNWTTQTIRTSGIGAPNPNAPMAAQRAGALRAARLDAYRNALETVKGVFLSSETTVENAMLTSDVIKTRIDGAIKGAKVVDTRYMSTGDVEVDIEVPLVGIISDAILPGPQAFGGGTLQTSNQPLCPTCGQPWPSDRPLPQGVNLAAGTPSAGSDNSTFTGLVIDARGLGVRPAMAPKVVDNEGAEVYGSKFVSREYAVDIGMVGYEKDLNRAKANERVTDNPLVIKAVQGSGPNKTDVVVSSGDAQKIHGAAANMNFLQHCKVMFILD